MPNRTEDLNLALIMCPLWGITQPPVSIAYLKGFLNDSGIAAKCFDFNVALSKVFPEKKYWDLNYPEYFIDPRLFNTGILPNLNPLINVWAEEILEYSPQVVGFSLFMSNVNTSLLLARELKKIKPDLIIVGGGPEVTRFKRILVDGIRRIAYLHRELIDANVFDLFIYGEGEKTLLEALSLIRQKSDFYSAKGCLYLNNDELIANRPREFVSDLDILPPPDYRDFELKDYTRTVLPLVTSRGCVNRCAFCSDSPLWKIYRHKSAEKVLEEVKFLINEYGINEFEIIDSTFNGDIERVNKICDLIIESKLNIRWSAKATLRKEMNYKLLQKMKKAGCTSLSYGVESGSPRVLIDMMKHTNIADSERIIRNTWKAGIRTNCFFIIGYPIETEEDFQLTLGFIRNNAKFIYRFDQITGCHIEEGSYLGFNLDKYGIILEKDGWYSPYSSPQIRKERLEKFREFARELHKHYECEIQL
jgi:radical SAM superfamily enzyme YgiQ (UPF0313 family)